MKSYKIFYSRLIEGEEFPGTTIIAGSSIDDARKRFFRSVAQFDVDYKISNIEEI